MANSLDSAIADGTVSQYAAFGGLSKEDIRNLYRVKHFGLDVLVRLRGKNGDARKVLSVEEFVYWQDNKTTLVAQETEFTWLEVRDVSGVAR